MSKYKILDVKYWLLKTGGCYKQVRLEVGSGVLHVFLVDIPSDPLLYRRQPLEELAEVASQFNAEPVVMMGDFNTPADSLHFNALRNSFSHAFELHGDGYAATWPLPLPVLQLDHIWANRRVDVSRCIAGWSSSSDHRPVMAWIRIN
jgi:endonuclease/exonuclease/phosphatase (EEP) superfamily protein YafD